MKKIAVTFLLHLLVFSAPAIYFSPEAQAVSAPAQTASQTRDSEVKPIADENAALEREVRDLKERLEAKKRDQALEQERAKAEKKLAEARGEERAKQGSAQPESAPPRQLNFEKTPPIEKTPPVQKNQPSVAGKLDLADCIERSILVSLPKEIAEQHKKQYRWTLTKALRDLFPEVTFTFLAESGRITSGNYTDRHYYFDVKQPMFRGFTLVNAVMQETYNKRASRAEMLQAVNDAALNTIISYFELTRAEGIYANHEELGREAARLLDQSERRKTKGIISEIEYLNVRSLAGEIEQEKEALLGEREVAAIELKKNLRLPPDEPVEIEPVYDTGSYNPKRLAEQGREREQEAGKIKIREARTLDDFIVLAYQHRPDLKMEENRLTATRYAEKIAKGGWLPRSDLSLKMGQDAQTLRPAFERPPFKNEWSVMVETSWNLAGNTLKHNYSNTDTPPSFTTFQGSSGTTRLNNTFSAQLLDGLKQYADVHQAKAQTAEQLKAYEDMEQQTVRDVVEAFYKYRSSLIRLRATAAGMEYRRRSAELSRLKLGKNEIQISEHLEALRVLATQRDDYHTAMTDYFNSKAKLNHAVGIQNFVPVDDLADVRMSK